MRFSITASILALGTVSQVLAYPSFFPENGLVGLTGDTDRSNIPHEIEGDDPNQWIPPKEGDGKWFVGNDFNLANHGYLPRNGRDISESQLYDVMFKVAGIDKAGVDTLGGKEALKFSSTGTFSLDDLNAHDVIEHDCSLSRDNSQSGNNWSFDAQIWATVSSFFNTPLVSTMQLGRAIKFRQDSDPLNDPARALSPEANMRSLIDAAVLWRVFHNGEGANLAWINTLFEQERLPFAEGWDFPSERISSFEILDTAVSIGLDIILGQRESGTMDS
ncbi:putative sterigmatocystin biosynthesis peroxidase stcC [Ceratocystis lukuohia]|uniref:Sterigmatocystin biosynthesis peroxidase stcC n=1 Tax=Ceratocystis lukuohia TaxID=2019550 RepID=A0ABR4MHH6_9PEZI